MLPLANHQNGTGSLSNDALSHRPQQQMLDRAPSVTADHHKVHVLVPRDSHDLGKGVPGLDQNASILDSEFLQDCFRAITATVV